MFEKNKSSNSFKKYISQGRAKGQSLKFGTNVGIKSNLSSATKRGQLKNLRDNLPAITKALEKNASRIRRGKYFSDKELKKIYYGIKRDDSNITKEDKKEIKLLLKLIGKKENTFSSDNQGKKNITRRTETGLDDVSKRPGMVNAAGRYKVSALAPDKNMTNSDTPNTRGFVSQGGRRRVSSSRQESNSSNNNVGGFALRKGGR
jgi:hypothetical protein